jgi:hypothetical protein
VVARPVLAESEAPPVVSEPADTPSVEVEVVVELVEEASVSPVVVVLVDPVPPMGATHCPENSPDSFPYARPDSQSALGKLQ